jgi:hypothetical protein
MTNAVSGEETQGKTYSAKIHVKSYSAASCAFCWFFLTIYPTLEGMSPRDEAIYSAHLKKAHGLTGEIQQ